MLVCLIEFTIRYWAIAIPSFLIVTVVLAMVSYLGLNFMVTPPPTSFNIMFGKCLATLMVVYVTNFI